MTNFFTFISEHKFQTYKKIKFFKKSKILLNYIAKGYYEDWKCYVSLRIYPIVYNQR